MHIDLDKNAEFIINRLNVNGYSAYAVGGAVRDAVIGKKIDDTDIATSAVPNDIKRIFCDFSVIETGIRHGTVTVIINKKPYEITTFRTDGRYIDKRHPENVIFVNNIKADLSRRDFTVNAVAYSEREGIIDPFGGIKDIEAKIIRTVGTPEIRFSEDALRILRALRFSATLGFSIAPETANAVGTLAKSLLSVSRERINAEMKKLLCGDYALEVIESYKSILSEIIYIQPDISKLPYLEKDYPTRLAYVCGDKVLSAAKFLKCDNATKKAAAMLAFSEPIPLEITAIKSYISSIGRENIKKVLNYRRTVFGEDISGQSENVLNSGECLYLDELEINGNDLSSIGIKGKNIGQTLQYLLTEVISGKIENKKELLLKLAKSLDNQK